MMETKNKLKEKSILIEILKSDYIALALYDMKLLQLIKLESSTKNSSILSIIDVTEPISCSGGVLYTSNKEKVKDNSVENFYFMIAHD